MNTFMDNADYLPFLRDVNLQRMIEDDDSILMAAEDMAISTVKDSLFTYYDTNAIFGLTGDDRPKQVVRWVVVLTLYYLYERLPAKMMPERINDNYQEVMTWLKDIEDGKKPVNLPKVQKADGSGPATKFRWGSVGAQNKHNL